MSNGSRRVLSLTLAVTITAVVSGSTVYLWQKQAKPGRDDVERPPSMFFKVYGADREAMDSNGEINFYVTVPDTLSLLDKLTSLGDKLSRFQFRGLPVEVMEIEERDGGTVAVVNLTESEWNRKLFAEYERALSDGRNADDIYDRIGGATWRQYFAGSTGGHFTALTLIKTLLQPDYEGEWIDGVQFLYEGKPIEYDHVGALRQTRYRDEW